MKTHIIYWFLIILTIIICNAKNILYWYLDLNKEGYLKLKSDVELFNPKNGEIVGWLKKGIVLKYPNVDDLKDCDLGDNDRFKILIDLEGVDRKIRVYKDSVNEVFDENNINYYNAVILRPVKNKG